MRLFRPKPPQQQQQQPADVAAELDQPGFCWLRSSSNSSSNHKADKNGRPFTHILITGASSGLGAALATAAAAPGVTLTLLGRSKERLEAVAAAARIKGAAVSTEVVDVRDKEAVLGAVWRADAGAPLDLVIANAGLLSPSSSTTTSPTPSAAAPPTQHSNLGAESARAGAESSVSGGGGESGAWHHLAGLAEGLEELAATNIGGTINTLSAAMCLAASRLDSRTPPPSTASPTSNTLPQRLHVAVVSSVSALAPRATLFAGLLGQRLTPYAWTKQSLALLAAGVQGELLAGGGSDVLSVSLVTPGVMVTPGAVTLAAATTSGGSGPSAAAGGAGGGGVEEEILKKQFGAVRVEEAAATILQGCAERQPLIAFPQRAVRILSLLRLAPTTWLAGRVRAAMAKHQPPPSLHQQQQQQVVVGEPQQQAPADTGRAGKDSSSSATAAGVGAHNKVVVWGAASGWKEAAGGGIPVISTTPQRRTDTGGSSGSGASTWSGGSSSSGGVEAGAGGGLVVVTPVGGGGDK